MGMIGNLARISEETASKLSRHPESIRCFLYQERLIESNSKRGLFARLGINSTKHGCARIASAYPPLAESDRFDLDRSWHVLHYLFTGDPWDGEFPEGFLVSCGMEVGTINVGYGPARLFIAVEVRAIRDFLDIVSEATLLDRYDKHAMKQAELYGFIAETDEEKQQEIGRLVEYIDSIRIFIRETAERNCALLAYIN